MYIIHLHVYVNPLVLYNSTEKKQWRPIKQSMPAVKAVEVK